MKGLAPGQETLFLARMVSSRWLLASLLALTVTCSGVLAAGARKSPTRPAASAPATYKGAIVTDAATGKVLFEENADTLGAPASMTKLMTFAVVHDRLASGALTLATPVKIDSTDAKMGGTQVFLDPRETFTVEELIYAMMIQSANDASHALARVAAGAIPVFVDLMNAKAKELGMTNTTFRTPHGLPPSNRKIADGDLTTPRDFAILCRHLALKTDALKYTSIRTRRFGEGARKQPTEMVNHNHLVGKVAGVDGLKTGFTNGAGFCLSATAQRHGRRVIVVTMGSPDAKSRDLKVTELLERGFVALGPPPAGALAANTAADSPIRPAPAGSAPAPKPTPAAPAAAGEPVIKFSLPKR